MSPRGRQPAWRRRPAPSTAWRRVRLLTVTLVVIAIGLISIERMLSSLLPFPLHRIDDLSRSTIRCSRLAEIPPVLVEALLCAEDRRFHSHRGVDGMAVLRATCQNLGAGTAVASASTISMQLVRILIPAGSNNPWSKFEEVFRARQLERCLGKRRILELYCNHVSLGAGIRGFEAGACRWFGMPARELSTAQAVTLVCMLPAPGPSSPRRVPSVLLELRNRLLARLRDRGRLTPAQYLDAVRAPLAICG